MKIYYRIITVCCLSICQETVIYFHIKWVYNIFIGKNINNCIIGDTKMNEQLKLSIVEMELAGMYAKLQSMAQTMVKSSDKEFAQLQDISDQIDKLRRQLGVKIELMNS